MDDLTSRNFQAVKQAVDMLGSKLDQERDKRMALENQVTMLTQQIASMMQTVSVIQFKQMGRGPTA